jgi:hypothetical protein
MTPDSPHLRVYRRLLRLYPRSFRSEYDTELTRVFTELLSDLGPRRAWVRVLLDLVRTVPRYRMEDIMKTPRSNRAILGASLAVIASIAGLIWAAGELSGGLSEALRHWWSTLPVLALAASLVALVVFLRRPGSSPRRDH